MKIVFLNKRTTISKFKNKDVLNLTIYSTLEKYFDINPNEYFNLIKPINSSKFKDSYLQKIDFIGSQFINKSKSLNVSSQVLSYRTFSKLSVSDNLVDKFWVLEQIDFFKFTNSIIFVDDIDIYNIYKRNKIKFKIFEFIPYKLIFYFFLIFINKLKSLKYKNIILPSNEFKLFVGNKFELKRNNNLIYEDYFFSKYWKNDKNSLLLLNIGEWNSTIKTSNNILFKESFLTFSNLINLLIVSLKHFYNPLQIKVNSFEDQLINKNLLIDIKTGSFIDSYQNYYIYNNLYKALNNVQGKLIIPHEGRSYERIVCLIFRKLNIKVIGYAHFPVSLRIFNYYYGNLEKIIYDNFSFYTLSKSNYDHFKNTYKWPISKFKIGAHLKVNIINDTIISKKEFDILILLGNEINQNIKLLKFIEYSIRNLDLKVLVRMHPSSRGIKILHNFFRKFSFIKNSTNSVLSKDVELAKIIVYGDTGASIDCLNFHVPLCYIYDDNCLLSDRINELIPGHFRFYEFNDFKLALPKLLVANNHFSFVTIKNNYISPIKPYSFSFE